MSINWKVEGGVIAFLSWYVLATVAKCIPRHCANLQPTVESLLKSVCVCVCTPYYNSVC